MLLSSLTVTLVVSLSALPSEGAQALNDRDGLSSTIRAVSTLEKLYRSRKDDPERIEALLRARFFLGESDGVDDRKIHEETLALGLLHFGWSLKRSKLDFRGLLERLDHVPKSSDGALFWTMLAFGRTIPHRFVFDRAGAAKDFQKMAEALVERSPTVFFGGPYRALAMYKLRTPGFLGGSKKEAIQLALRAVKVAPEFAGNRLTFARVALESGRDKGKIRSVLNRALECPSSMPEHAGPEQARGKLRARALLNELEAR